MQKILWTGEPGETLSELLETLGICRCMLVCGASYDGLGIRGAFERRLALRFSSFTPNPLWEQVEDGTALFREAGCDSLLAVGGGSAMDVAKCIKLRAGGQALPLIALPTTAGTGSESTRFAVVYRDGVKQSVADPCILPDYAVLAPGVLKTLPLYPKQCALLDALCQGVESWWSLNSTGESRGLSKRAVEQIRNHMDGYLAGDEAAGGPILEAANLAGQAINSTQTTAAHAMSYKLTSLYHIPHGHAVALCLPEVWQHMLEHPQALRDPRGPAHLEGVLRDAARALGCPGPAEAVAWLRELPDRLGMKRPAPKNCEEELPALVASVDPTRLANHPASLGEADFIVLYGRILNHGA